MLQQIESLPSAKMLTDTVVVNNRYIVKLGVIVLKFRPGLVVVN